MGKRKRESSMEKYRELKEKFKELEQHKYWDYSNNLRALTLISRSPRKLMSFLQTNHTNYLSSDEENNSLSSNACTVCSDCFENEESEEEVRSVVVSSASVRSDFCYNEESDDGVNKIYEGEKEIEINKGSAEMVTSIGTDVKNAEKISSKGLGFSVLIIVLVLIVLVIAVMLSVSAAWYVDQDLDQVFLPPT